MPKEFEPLLSKAVEFNLLDYRNLWLSPKLDGIRAIIRDGVVLSRKLLPIPNRHVQSVFGKRPELEHFDGELIVGSPTSPTVYSDTYSGVMSEDGTPDVTFYAFDHIGFPDLEYQLRYKELVTDHSAVKVLPQHRVEAQSDLEMFEKYFLELGYEGVMLRAFSGPNSKYKFGRSTAKSNTLLKLKRFTDAEAKIIDFQEQMYNGNEATKDETGRTKRSSHAENKVGKGTLGALICEDLESGVKFNIGTGMNDAIRQQIWDNRSKFLNTLVKYKSFKIGVKDAPRFPVFLGFRSPMDL